MSYLISDLYSVAPVQNIEWFLYVVDVSANAEGTVEGRYVRENMLKIGQELGATAAFVVGVTASRSPRFTISGKNTSAAKSSKLSSSRLRAACQWSPRGTPCPTQTPWRSFLYPTIVHHTTAPSGRQR